MPRLSVFPKCYMDALCVTKTMTLFEWIDLAATLDVDGVEMYPGFFESFEPAYLERVRAHLARVGLEAPMMCASPDFTQPEAEARQAEVERERHMIDVTAALGGRYCRVLSGQRRDEVSRADGVRWTVECITSLLDTAAARGVVLNIENHYKDGYWQHPEFAQKMDLFLDLVSRINDPNFGVNYDPSNTILAGEDPLALLDKVKHRVVTMHASDRYLAEGTIEDLRKEEDVTGYANRLRHGEIGRGMNDYGAIFTELKFVGFDGWISIEDGVDGIEQLRRSVEFLRRKIAEHW